MKILGLSCYFHDAAAALVVDGEVVAAAEEERFTRVKHDARFPAQAVAFCLAHAGIPADELDAVVFYEKPLTKFERMVATARTAPPESWTDFSQRLIRQRHEGANVEHELRSRLDYRGPVWFTEHHVAHAASAFFPSPFERAAVVTIDGVGEWATTTIGIGDGASYRVLSELHYPISLGLFYSAMTSFLGFQVNSDEYKVMGLASYGTPRFTTALDQIMRVVDDDITIDMDFFTYQSSTTRMYSEKLERLLGPAYAPGATADQRQMDIAASVQAKLEQAYSALLRIAHQKTGETNLCLAGGVALNGVANWRCFQASPFTNIYVPPMAGDSGGAVGAALYAYHTTTGGRLVSGTFSPYQGPSFSDAEAKRAIDMAGLSCREFPSDDEFFAAVAGEIKDDRIVGWFQGRMEVGPRALGSRSIIANAANGEMKDIINSCVKFREEFRPFAPAVIEERAEEFFELDGQPSPYMTPVPCARPGAAARIPAVVHVDNTSRVQTVSRSLNPRFHSLLSHVDTATGVPVVLNTSFNVKGEPIVCTPTDAIRCFLNTDIDVLALNNYIVTKEV